MHGRREKWQTLQVLSPIFSSTAELSCFCDFQTGQETVSDILQLYNTNTPYLLLILIFQFSCKLHIKLCYLI